MTKKEQILETALKLFATQGVGDTSTAQITKEAGVAEGTLFVHFKNKASLVDVVFTYIKQREAEVFLAALDVEQGAEANIKALTKKMVQHFTQNYNEFLFIENVKYLKLVSPEAIKKANESFAELQKPFFVWQKEGHIKQTNLDALGAMAWSMMFALTRYCKEHNKKVTDDLVEPIWNAFQP